ncbi:AdoMet-homocysteine methyltransferase [Stygiomarasmius scandens]|uniref:AdoMet-homocysteine methyltransferase n=1 Tax=Marasmiellus scandens TaxID=2682957 RepID=A0ABR1J7H4_9AGAR
MRIVPFFLLSLVSFALARDGDDDDDDDRSTQASQTSSANSAAASGSSQTGGSQCTNLMCITGIVNGSNVEWTLSPKAGQELGWMAIGFGTQMTGSPMVIMWSNSDDTITLSQREASGEFEPSVVSNPDKVATLLESASSTSGSGSDIKFTFSIPSDGSTRQNIIWALSSTNPGDSAIDASLTQHLDSGPLSFDLSGGSTSGSVEIPLLSYQKLIVAHALLCVFGFLFFLPAGALLARYLRTFSPTWYTGHWIAQFGIAGPIIIVGFALGVRSVSSAGAPHLDDGHKKKGVAIFVLYLFQCALGAIIHFFKPRRNTGRPPQNYIHAILGLLVIGLALFQVRDGYREEWPETTRRDPLPKGVDVVWYIWVVLLPVLYAVGLAFLPKQYKQEAESRGKMPPTGGDSSSF